MQALLGDDPSLAPLTPLLIARTEGNPFFLEESVRTLVETGVLVGEPGAYRLAQAAADHSGPGDSAGGAGSPHRPPAARGETPAPDRCGHWHGGTLAAAARDRRAARGRRCIGAWRTCRRPSFSTRPACFPSRLYLQARPDPEVAYGSLLQERRRALHARIVEALEALAGDRVAEQVERLAYHALRGEVWDKALAYCRQAGEKAMARSAYREAVGCFEQALAALTHLPETRDTREQAIDLRLALRSALRRLATLGVSWRVLREAEALAAALDDPRRLGQVSLFLSQLFLPHGGV